MTREIGEVFEYDGVMLEVIDGSDCDMCYFKETECISRNYHITRSCSDRQFKQISQNKTHKQMTKKDLKAGMIAELRNGEKYLVITDCDTPHQGKQDFCLICNNNFHISNEYDDYLTRNKSSLRMLDIMKIYYNKVSGATLNMTCDNLIWEREKRETIEIGGQKYNKAEFEQAVKHLKPIE